MKKFNTVFMPLIKMKNFDVEEKQFKINFLRQISNLKNMVDHSTVISLYILKNNLNEIWMGQKFF